MHSVNVLHVVVKKLFAVKRLSARVAMPGLDRRVICLNVGYESSEGLEGDFTKLTEM